jgi:hypothetical protein
MELSMIAMPSRLRVAALIVLSAALVGCASTPAPDAPAARTPAAVEISADALLDRAIARAGGASALSYARRLSWEGTAVVHAGDRDIAISVMTQVLPFTRAQSSSWPTEAGRAATRMFEIDGDDGWIGAEGQRTAMDPNAQRHERLQFAVYGLMRLVNLRDPGATYTLLTPDAEGRHGLRVSHPQAAPADLYFDADGRLAYLKNHVPAADGEGDHEQVFTFAGELSASGVRWPQKISITQDGAPYFDLNISILTIDPE